MKKSTTIILFLILLLTGCGSSKALESENSVKTESSFVEETLESEKPVEAKSFDSNITPVKWELTENSFSSYEENLKYDNAETKYFYDGYTFIRSSNSLSIKPSDIEGPYQYIIGSNFILCENEIWFLNNERNIARFKYKDFYYSDESLSDLSYAYSEAYSVFQNADLPSYKSTEVEKFCKWDEFVEVNAKPIAFAISNATVLFDENRFYIYKNENFSYVPFPFSFKEVGLSEYNFLTDSYTYSFVSTTNTVGTIKVNSSGNIMYNIIAEGNDKERNLFHSTPENKVTRIDMSDGFIIYYENGKLIGSNGDLHFHFDDMPYKTMWLGESYGVGKGFELCSFLSKYSDTNVTDVTKMVTETGINY